MKLPKATGIGGLFSRYPPSYEVEIEIRRGNEPDESTPPAWLLGENFILSFFGKVVDGSSDGVTTELSVSRWVIACPAPEIAETICAIAHTWCSAQCVGLILFR